MLSQWGSKLNFWKNLSVAIVRYKLRKINWTYKFSVGCVWVHVGWLVTDGRIALRICVPAQSRWFRIYVCERNGIGGEGGGPRVFWKARTWVLGKFHVCKYVYLFMLSHLQTTLQMNSNAFDSVLLRLLFFFYLRAVWYGMDNLTVNGKCASTSTHTHTRNVSDQWISSSFIYTLSVSLHDCYRF